VLPGTALDRDAHVDPSALLVGQAMDLGSGLVAEHSAGPHVGGAAIRNDWSALARVPG